MMFAKLFRKTLAAAGAAGLLLASAGCLYPDGNSPGSDASARESVMLVQDAIDRYREQTGLLPIQNADESTPQYEKYKIDFGKLQRSGYLANVPKAAFENGGNYQFLIIDEIADPTVKLLDLNVFQTIADVQKKAAAYASANANRVPAGDERYPGFYALDYAKLGMKAPAIRSMYSQQTLELLVDGEGIVYADYGIDIATALRKENAAPLPEEDLRRALTEASYFVPVRSPVYHWTDGEPQAILP
ncbi:hypothetical protein ACF3MZ_06950 [Paenibacillaceae bacterium WGS1546]|uniref:hypothetical protein n=1 Tax=Cohnella sp. WGS1546 TaxID=3366810 RepID=UPI00372D7561